MRKDVQLASMEVPLIRRETRREYVGRSVEPDISIPRHCQEDNNNGIYHWAKLKMATLEGGAVLGPLTQRMEP